MEELKMGWTSWGIKPWWNAVKWWWPRDKAKSARIAIVSAIPAVLFSIRYGGLEATKENCCSKAKRQIERLRSELEEARKPIIFVTNTTPPYRCIVKGPADITVERWQ